MAAGAGVHRTSYFGGLENLPHRVAIGTRIVRWRIKRDPQREKPLEDFQKVDAGGFLD